MHGDWCLVPSAHQLEEPKSREGPAVQPTATAPEIGGLYSYITTAAQTKTFASGALGTGTDQPSSSSHEAPASSSNEAPATGATNEVHALQPLSAAPKRLVDIQGGELADQEKDKITKLLNRGLSREDVLELLFEMADEAKRAAASAFITKLVRTPRPHPTDRKQLHVKTSEPHVLPVYHYNSKFDPTKKYYTFVLVGGSGVGKTTLLDAFTNYLAGMHYDDTWRWKLVDEDHMKDKHTSESQTTDISVYYISDSTGQSCHVKLIDTPGFLDTSGPGADNRTVQKFKTLFEEDEKVDQVDYILLCVPAGETRWTPATRYVYDSILKMFGKDAEEKFILMCTFADAGEPRCIETLKPHVKWSQAFRFNNSALYTPASKGNEMTKPTWDMGTQSVGDFLAYVQKANAVPLSLKLSKEVLERREVLQVGVESAMKRVDDGFKELESVQKVIKLIKENEEQINENASFEYEESEYKYHRVPIPNGKVYQLCSVCQVTCCQSCVWPANATESQCSYFRDGRSCPKCPGRCPKSVHVRTREVVTKELRTVKKVWEHKKNAYEAGQAGLSTAQALLEEKEEKVRDIWKQVSADIQFVKANLAELDKIALKPRAFTEVDFFQKLIDDEKENKKPGYEGRVEDYELFLKRAKTLEQMSAAEKPEDMFPQYEEVINHLINRNR